MHVAFAIKGIPHRLGLDAVFYPHVATHFETPLEVQGLFGALANTGTGLCLDTGHCVYGGGDPSNEAQKYRALLRYVRIKDINAPVLGELRRKKRKFEQAVAAGVFSQVGRGCVDCRGFFNKLVEGGYSAWMIVEQDMAYGKTTVSPVGSMWQSLHYPEGIVA